jgi:hypothetical protein
VFIFALTQEFNLFLFDENTIQTIYDEKRGGKIFDVIKGQLLLVLQQLQMLQGHSSPYQQEFFYLSQYLLY